MLLAQADGGGVLPRNRSVSGATVLSGLLHAGAAIVFIGFQAAPRVQDLPEPLAVEIVLEAPVPPVPSPPPSPPPAPSQITTPAPTAPLAVPRRAVVAPLRPATVSRTAKPAPALADTSATMEQASAEASPPTAPTAPTTQPQREAAPPPAVAAVDYGAYVGRLHQRIAQHRIYPPQAMRRHEEGDVHLRILLSGDGRLLDILSLAEASAQLTRAARQAVESAAPFDPPPRLGGGERLAFDVTVAFRLR